QMNTEKFIKYNISAKVSVKQFFSGQVNRKRLLGVFLGIVNAVISAEEYMIDINTILLDTEYMYADVSTCNTVLICLPVNNEIAQPLDLGTFFKTIVFGIQYDQTENADYVGKIINYLNSTPSFSVYDFKNILDEISREDLSRHDERENGREHGYRQGSLPAQSSMQIKSQDGYDVDATTQEDVISKTLKHIENEKKEEHTRQTAAENKTAGTLPQQFAIPSQKMADNTVLQFNGSVQKSTEDKSNAGIQEHPPMSRLYLLRHYTKENAEIYKAQQEQKKNRNNEKKSKTDGQSNGGFAIPGQQSFIVSQNSGSVGTEQKNHPRQSVLNDQTHGVRLQNGKQDGVQSQNVSSQNVQQAYVGQQQAVSQEAKNFGETVVLSQSTSAETSVLYVNPLSVEVKPYLIRLKNNEKIIIDKEVFRIGKEKSFVDYFIGDNPAISRSHAYIIMRDGEYYIVDTNSRNHTYVNGIMINSNTEHKLENGASIRFANEDFEYKAI
ncbi:MAG: FHA domain-containing protein, partial [Lachnospiraceae bacterium]|nr:FHA domain-containing protein [Lachnospiraceae bacterium]